MRPLCIAACALLAVCLATGRRKKTAAKAGAVSANAAPRRAPETSRTADDEADVVPLIDVYLKEVSEYLAARIRSQAEALKFKMIVERLKKNHGMPGPEGEAPAASLNADTVKRLEMSEKRTSDYRHTLHKSLDSIALTLAFELRDMGALDIPAREQAFADEQSTKCEVYKARQEAAQAELELAAKDFSFPILTSRDVRAQAEQAHASFVAASSKVLNAHRDLELAYFRAKLARARAEAARGALDDTCAVRVRLERGLGSIATGARIYFNMEYQAVHALDTLDTEWDAIEAEAHSQIAAFRDGAAKERPAQWSPQKGAEMHHSVTQRRYALSEMYDRFKTAVSGLGFGRRRLFILSKALIHLVETGFAASLGVEPEQASLLSTFLEFATPSEAKDPHAPGSAPVCASANGALSLASSGKKASAPSSIQQKTKEAAKIQPVKPSKKKTQRNAKAADPTASGMAERAESTSNDPATLNEEAKQTLAAAFKVLSTIEMQSGLLQDRLIMPAATSQAQSTHAAPTQSPRGKSTRLIPNQVTNAADCTQGSQTTAPSGSSVTADLLAFASDSINDQSDEHRADRETKIKFTRPAEVSHEVVERTIAAAVSKQVDQKTVKLLSDMLQNSIEGVFANHTPERLVMPVPNTHNMLKPFFTQFAHDFAIQMVKEMRDEAKRLRQKERDAAFSLVQTLAAKEEADTALSHFRLPYLAPSGRFMRSREIVDMDARLCVLAAQATLAVARAERFYMELRIDRADCEVMCTLDGVLSLLGLDDQPLAIDSMLAQSQK